MENQNDASEKHIGETKAIPNYVHDLLHDLSNRVDAIWRYDQYIANSKNGGSEEETKLWNELKTSEMTTVDRLKTIYTPPFCMIARHCVMLV